MDIKENSHSLENKLSLEKSGYNRLKKLVKSLENEPWSVTLLQLAWTAGPITFLALQGGYFLGYGKNAPLSLFTYFAGYTILAGVMGIFTSVIFKHFNQKEKEDAERNLRYTIDNTLVFCGRITDFYLSLLGKKERKMEVARQLLANTHALPDDIYLAFMELTNNSKIAHEAKKIEQLRRYSLRVLIDQTYNKNSLFFQKKIKRLKKTYPEIAMLVQKRIQGEAPSLKMGVQRVDGFLRRIYKALEVNDKELFSIRDCIEFFHFLYEILNDRKIAVFYFNYKGNRELEKANTNLEKIRAFYSLDCATVNYHINYLETQLIDAGFMHEITGLSIQERVDQICSAMNSVAEIVLNKDKLEANGSTSDLAMFFKNLYIHYGQIVNHYQIVIKNCRKLNKAISRWMLASNKIDKKRPLFRIGKGKRGLRIYEEKWGLDDSQKIRLAKLLSGYLQHMERQFPHYCAVSEAKIKRCFLNLAHEILSITDLCNPLVQYSIESSQAANFSSIENDISVESKLFWARAIVKEVEPDLSTTALNLAKTLIEQYGIELSDEAYDFLKKEYNVDVNKIRKLVKKTQPFSFQGLSLELTNKPDFQSWKRAFSQA